MAQTAAEIQIELDEVRCAIKAVLLGQEYTFDTGMTKQTVKRADLGSLQKYKETLESDLSMAELKEGGCQITRGISS